METTNEKKTDSVFAVLNGIDCNSHAEKKNGLTFLSWVWAWAEVKKNYPDAFYTIYENPQGFPYFNDGRTAWVKTGVTIHGLEHIEYLPIMNDAAHASLPLASITSWHVNKAIQRSLTKACARHGLGLYIYAGEDLPEAVKEAEPAPAPAPATEKKGTKKAANTTAAPAPQQAAPAPEEEPMQEPPIPEQLTFTPLDKEKYWKYVKCAAEGIPMKSGIDAKRSYIKVTHAGPVEIDKFEQDVQDYQAAKLK